MFLSLGLFSSSIICSINNTLRNQRKIYNIPCGNQSDEDHGFDVIVVGSGPAGSTAAFFLSKYGKRVALLDKKVFPRAKPCGDAWCAPALDILEEMGVLSKMEQDKIVNSVTRGGFISPFGYECINRDGSTYGSVSGCRTYAIKRYIADKYLVDAAASNSNVNLFQEHNVTGAEFDEINLNWSVFAEVGNSKTSKTIKGKILLICDGTHSYLAKKLGIIPQDSKPEVRFMH